MSDFEFTSVVVAILIAFAFSEVLASWGRLIRRRARVTISWLYLGTSSLFLLALVGHWLGMSTYRALPAITAAESLLVFAPSFIAALLAAFLLFAGLSDRVVLGEDVVPLWTYLARAAILLPPAFSRRASVHAGALVLTALAPIVLGTALLASESS